MNIEQQVCTNEQSFKLQDLGVLQDAHYYRMENDSNEIILMRRDEIIKIFEENILETKREEEGIQNGQMISYKESDLQNIAQQMFSSAIPKFNHDIVAAFTVAELGVMLPEWLKEGNDDYKLSQWKRCNDIIDYGIRFINTNHGDEFINKKSKFNVLFFASTEAEARAEMLIYLLEEKLTTPEQVNTRLS